MLPDGVADTERGFADVASETARAIDAETARSLSKIENERKMFTVDIQLRSDQARM
ncbi:MAG: hypothetical protein IT209_09295 [Armatimonadetes bacterium]|nr:hypothetical protein [Armatimonadota bacterium]